MGKVEIKKSDRQNPKHNPRPKGKACMSRKPKVPSLAFWNHALREEDRITKEEFKQAEREIKLLRRRV